MSNGVFQNVINQLRDATDRVIGVIDAEGCVVACTDNALLGERWSDAALKVGSAYDSVVTYGQKTYKTMVGNGNFFENAVFCTGEDDLARAMCVAAFVALAWLRYRVPAGNYVYLICFIGAWVTDTFAYFSGYLFGKHKLIPDVSPKKTVEGSIGGTLFCILAMIGYGWLVQLISGGAVSANYLVLGISGLFIAVVAQVGDLLMSAIKRTYGIKDYGKLFPGHGGVLDRFDSVMAVAVVLAVISSITNLFTVV